MVRLADGVGRPAHCLGGSIGCVARAAGFHRHVTGDRAGANTSAAHAPPPILDSCMDWDDQTRVPKQGRAGHRPRQFGTGIPRDQVWALTPYGSV
jgi:hypothetical protein